MSKHYEATALFALPRVKEGSTEEAGLLNWTRPLLFEEVRNRGIDVAVVRGADSLKVETAEQVIRPEYNGSDVAIHHLGDVGLRDFGVVRNIVRSVEVTAEVPFLNPNAVRRLARNKSGMAHILQSLGVYNRRSHLVAPDQPLEDVLDDIPGDTIVAKPNGGQRSRGVLVGRKQIIAQALPTQERQPYIIEEKLDFSAPFPSIRGLNEQETARLKTANEQGVNKELRLYYFGDNQWDTVGRTAKEGETDFHSDTWLQVDLDSIPGSLVENSSKVVRAIQEVTGEDEFNIAIDWVYARSASNPDTSWQVMEVNGAEPQLVQPHEHESVGRRQHEKLATQISRIALR